MSLTSAFNSAFSGLSAASRTSLLVSENIANALTPGYARRTLNLSSHGQGVPGVLIGGITRHSDPGIVANRRVADADYGIAKVMAEFRTRMTSAVGSSEDPTSVTARLATFEANLITAASFPESAQRLDTVALSARDLAASLSDTAESLRQMRASADRSIGQQVDRLNQALADVQKINVRITSTQSGGGSTASLLDQRQLLVDEINQIVPVNVVERDYGQIALYSNGGAILLDGPAARIGFTPANDVTPGMTIQNGALSGLDINGIAVRTDSRYGALTGGSLGAQFEIRDVVAIEAQADLDSVARDLVERFQSPGLDATLPAGAPGLFTDKGAFFNAANEVGLSGRLQLNAIVDPTQGGESWKLRDGLGTTVPGPTGEARFLQALGRALSDTRVLGSGNFGTGAMNAGQVGSNLLSRFVTASSVAEQRLSFASASKAELTQIELAQGVDTDTELQSLMEVEQAYAANARVIKAVEDMMDTLLRI